MKEDKNQKNAKETGEDVKNDANSAENIEEMQENPRIKDFAIYEKALKEMENALTKLGNELEDAKKEVVENANLARVYKKDLERFKERNKTAAEEMKEQALIVTAEKLIPILDNFGQALKVVTDSDVKKGFSMIEGSLNNVLFDMGIEEIESVGKKMDPNLHNVVAKRVTDDNELDAVIASELVKGYKIKGENGRVVRHAMVEVYIKE